MGLFKKKEHKEPASEANKRGGLEWNTITSHDDLEAIQERSKTKIQAIFKHSTRCGISRGVLKKIELKSSTVNDLDFHYLDLLNYRSISNQLADTYQVIHQSPQLLLIKDGNVVAHDSHYDIMSLDLSSF